MKEQQFPEPTCGALIFNPKGEVFLMKTHKWKGKYVIPGGHIELGETIEESLIREVKEETNLDVFDIQFICFQEFIYDDSFWKKKHFIFFEYSCKTKSTDVKLNSEAQSFVWVTLKEALNMPTEPFTRALIEKYIE